MNSESKNNNKKKIIEFNQKINKEGVHKIVLWTLLPFKTFK